ncbi:TylF/MycF/NovP-related O-methyltransferase [Pedobacter cryophilus]|uniref:Macrocin O-methyltransferase n=1 Tax=Pedobacter cryophilus TaxID=2571271 RepID=A0A4U1C0Z6_9SPHI|nr:TylF/MycF/NovP-related O-methyltransferase [Pedobacter cryophilus]TKB98627.1 macrocin O-methyltransferase [Pedobacter cryophilus]
MKKIIKYFLSKLNLEIQRKKRNLDLSISSDSLKKINELHFLQNQLHEEYSLYFTLDDLTLDEIQKINNVKQYTMTGPLRMISLIRAVEYIVKNNIPGAFVECGVWKGGSMMLIAKTLIELGELNRELYLYDTFEGMATPSSNDISFDNKIASILLEKELSEKENGNNIWCYSNIEEVKNNLLSIGYNPNKIHFIKGKVEDTIPNQIPHQIALLRLDTDWYESTIHELEYLYPILVNKGVMIIDDYGQWMGQKKAVDEYILNNKLDIYLNRIDFSSRLAIKY